MSILSSNSTLTVFAYLFPDCRRLPGNKSHHPESFSRLWGKIQFRMTDSDFRDAFHRHKDLLYRFVYRMTGSGSVAEDLVQECFTSLWENPGRYDSGRGALQAYLLRMARNLVFKRWSRECRYGSEEPEGLVCPPFDVPRMERSEAIAAAVQALPSLQREALVLAEYEELSLDEIARATGADLAAVKSRLHRARQNLRRVLAPLLETKRNLHGTPK